MTGQIVLHSYWPKDRPEEIKTRVLLGRLSDVANGLEGWWKADIRWRSTLRTLDGWLRACTGESSVTIRAGGPDECTVEWVHHVYLPERDARSGAMTEVGPPS